ncbi:MAG: hydroxymethylglutaryl-CoA reductase, degradative [Myxococcales bacterium]|nr:hydroxymethylglutaryl-CoA reductase, degradative [Myxococcales bacterium]
MSSRLPGFHARTLAERRAWLAEAFGLDEAELGAILDEGGLSIQQADKTIENVLGRFALPFAAVVNLRVDGRETLAPMVVEEPSVVAAASNAARIARAGGGFSTQTDEPLTIAQILLQGVADPERAAEAVQAERQELLAEADRAVPGLVARGGGARDVETRDLGSGLFAVHVLVDCRDAMGANLANTVAESLGDRVAALTGGRAVLRILSNLADRRLVRVHVRIPPDALAAEAQTGAVVRDGIVLASRFAELDPYRAATHNKGIMNGVDAVVVATGNDWRAVEAGAHAYAARRGRYEPLCTWSAGPDGTLVGRLEMPLAVGTVGGAQRAHPMARLALRLAGVQSARELASLIASVGMASNLAALRALVTDGIQRGHMALHARQVALAAGAQGDEVERVARRIAAAGEVCLERAHSELEALRRERTTAGH